MGWDLIKDAESPSPRSIDRQLAITLLDSTGCFILLSSSSSLALFFCTTDLQLLVFIDRQTPKLLLRSPLAILTTSVPDTRSYSALVVGMRGDLGVAWGILHLGWRRICVLAFVGARPATGR